MFVVKEKMEKKTVWRGRSEILRGGEKKWQIFGGAKTSREFAEWRRLDLKNLNKLHLPKRKGWSKRHKVSRWQGPPSHLCQKKKEQNHQSRSPNHEMEKSQCEQKVCLGVKEGIIAGACEGKSKFYTKKPVPSRRRNASKENLPRRSRRKHERMSGNKNSPEVC